MQPVAIALTLMLLSGAAQAQGIPACSAVGAAPAAAHSASSAPVAAEMVSPSQHLGAPSGVLAQALDESLSVDQVLYRIRMADCASLASLTPAPSPGALPAAPGAATTSDAIDPATYKPRTEFDNAPWRFDMNQNGKKMTADEFTAWMEAKGVRIVKPRATLAAAPTPAGQGPGEAAPPVIIGPDPDKPSDEGADPSP
ncbi:MAG: hypothetical protein H0T88_09580 [Lysobacter sp.]|nr:hypothetical protein [Lysobacter sp.]